MVKKTIILLVLYFLLFYLTSLREKEYFANSKELEPGFFAPWSRSHLKKNTRSPSWSCLGKKSGARAGASWKNSQEPESEPEPLKNLPAPQPWFAYVFLALVSKFIFRFAQLVHVYTVYMCVFMQNILSKWLAALKSAILNGFFSKMTRSIMTISYTT